MHAIREIVAVQESIGLQSVTDGEFRRRSYIIDFFQKALGPDGLGFEDSLFFHKNDKGDRVVLEALIVRGKARWSRPIFADDFAFVRSITTRTPKITLPSPAILHFLGGDGCHPRRRLFLDRRFLGRPHRGLSPRIRRAGKSRLHLRAGR